jgi:hypothetical protein
MHRARAPRCALGEPGGEGGIRTRGGVTPTHAFQACSFGHSDTSPARAEKSMAEGVGFEPTDPRQGVNGFRDRPDRPLRHPSAPGRIFYDEIRRLAKNSRSSDRASSAASPPRWASGGPRRASSARSTTVPQAPAWGSGAPHTSRPSRACRQAETHIGHGSRVTYRVQRSRRQQPTAEPAARSARTSAWPAGSASDSRRLPALATTTPSRTTTAPTGTSPIAAAARASASASAMNRRSSSSKSQSCSTVSP